MKLICISGLFLLMFSQYSLAQENANYENAYSAYEAGRIDESYIFLKNSLSDNPDHLPSKMLMAEVLALSGYFDDAALEFEESLADGADLNLVIEPYIRVLLTLGDYGKVIDLSEEPLTPIKKGFLRSAQATAYTFKQEQQKAEELHEKAFQIAPTSINVLNSAARYYLSTDRIELAKERLEQALNVNNKVSNTYELLAQYYSVKGDKKKQIDALQQGLAIAETHPVILRELVSAYASQGDFASAKSVLTKTLETSPDDPMASLLLSWVAAQLNENELSSNTLTTLVNQLSDIENDDLS